ncbi:MAG: hypothetical protein VX089_05390 [Pseudomonadota bacterium]|nr:hypothetical protein [Pseudomonadota bacterium]
MKNLAKYIKKIDNSLEILIKNRDLVRSAQKNLITLNQLQEQVKKNKDIKIETLDLINQIINEIDKLTSHNKNKSK